MTQIDGYCERIDASYWAEPINAITNLSFIIAAAVMLSRSRGLPMAQLLSLVIGVIGIGSYLFHTHAQIWSLIADVLPILGFILLYIFAINRDVLNLGNWKATLLTAGFIPYAALTIPLWGLVPVFNVSAGYMPVPFLILIYAVILRSRFPSLSNGFVIGASILVISLLFRSLDEELCSSFPSGTHFMWHILNGIMLGWMIETYRRHMIRLKTKPS